MGEVSINESGIEELFHDPDGPVGDIIKRKAQHVEEAAQHLLDAPGGGEAYSVTFFTSHGGHVHPGAPGEAHVASAPGQPPTTFHGDLKASITTEIFDDPKGVSARVGSHLYWALILEHGSKHMAPRPLWRPALDIGMAE